MACVRWLRVVVEVVIVVTDGGGSRFLSFCRVCMSGTDSIWPHGVASPRGERYCNRWSSYARAWPERSTAPPQPRMVLLVRVKVLRELR